MQRASDMPFSVKIDRNSFWSNFLPKTIIDEKQNIQEKEEVARLTESEREFVKKGYC